MIRAVIFDIDGVLMDSKVANMTWYRDFLARYGYRDLADADLERGHYYSLKEAITYLTKAPEATVQTILEDASELPGYPYELVALPEGSTNVLQTLATRYCLGIVSSRIHEGVRQFLDFADLPPDCFSVIVGFEDSTEHKPHAEPLLVAAQRLGVEPGEMVYVGDSPTDLACALAAGAQFIAYGDAVPDAEHRISCFDELERAIVELRP